MEGIALRCADRPKNQFCKGRDTGVMVIEHALLQVSPGREDEFEEAFVEASTIISSAQGFKSLRLERCIEHRSKYLFLVEWERLEDHTVTFRESPQFLRWRELLHHFYDPFPTIEHYEPVLSR